MLDDIDLPPGVTWSVQVGDAAGAVRFGHDPDAVCATASIGKTLLLATVARRLAEGTLRADQRCSRRRAEPVADSGVWQHLRSDELPLADVCALVGAVSDNLATNVLLDLVGITEVALTTSELGLTRTALHDLVRDERSDAHPPALSSGTARELWSLCRELADPKVIEPQAAELVRGWLALNTDLSMVAGAFGVDPLAHVSSDRGFRLWNKTGTNTGVRCDIGTVTYRSRQLTWAALANWTVTDDADPVRDDVLATMRAIGDGIRAELQEPSPCP